MDGCNELIESLLLEGKHFIGKNKTFKVSLVVEYLT